MVAGRYGYRYVPNRVSSVLMGVLVAGFGTLWTEMAASMGAPGFFPLFGVLFVCVGIGLSAYSYVKAGQYEEAHRRYQRRRAALRDPGGE